MELEELKLKWKVLSERLDREQVIRRQDMERMLRARMFVQDQYHEFHY